MVTEELSSWMNEFYKERVAHLNISAKFGIVGN